MHLNINEILIASNEIYNDLNKITYRTGANSYGDDIDMREVPGVLLRLLKRQHVICRHLEQLEHSINYLDSMIKPT